MIINKPMARASMATSLIFLQLVLGAFVLLLGARKFETEFLMALDEVDRASDFARGQLEPARQRLQELQALQSRRPARSELLGEEVLELQLPARGLTPDLHAAYFGLLEQQLRGASTGLRGLQSHSERLRTGLRVAHGELGRLLLVFAGLLLLSLLAMALWVLSEREGRGLEPGPWSAPLSSPRRSLRALWRRLRLWTAPSVPAPEHEPGAASPGQEVARACQLMGELQQSVQASSQAVERARLLSSGLGQQAARCQALMSEIVGQMQALRASVRQVRALVEPVDRIAFETQVLAVHGALVSVQAGQQDGALLATEVRALALRCTEAARDVKGCMAQAAEQVKQRGEQVFGAAQALGEIVASVERLAQITADVSFAGLIECQALEHLGQALRGLESALQDREARASS